MHTVDSIRLMATCCAMDVATMCYHLVTPTHRLTAPHEREVYDCARWCDVARVLRVSYHEIISTKPILGSVYETACIDHAVRALNETETYA